MATFPNGQIPAYAMKQLSVGGFLLPAAAQNFESWRAVARNAGWNLTITSAADAFRTYAIQERIFRERYTTTYLRGRPTKIWNGITYWLKPGQATAAVPGTSNHGKGLAVDIKNAGPFDVGFHAWMSETGPAFGWSNTEGRSIKEPWHWVNDNIARGAVGAIIDAIPDAQEEDEVVTPAEMDAIAHKVMTYALIQNGAAGAPTNLAEMVKNHDDYTIRTHQRLDAMVPAIVQAVLNTPIPKGGQFAGNVTTLAAVLSWYDDHITRILAATDGDNGQATSDPVDQEALKAAITATVRDALKDVSITLTNKE